MIEGIVLTTLLGGGAAGLSFALGKQIIPTLRNNREGSEGLRKEKRKRRKAHYRDSSILNVQDGVIRHTDGSYTKGYQLTPDTTLYSESDTLNRQVREWARFLREEKPTGTVIQFRLTNFPDPGEIILRHLDQTNGLETHEEATMLHTLGIAHLKDQCDGGAYRLPKLTAWVKVPNPDKKEGQFAKFQRGWNAGGLSLALEASQNHGIVKRLAAQEAEAFKKASKTFRSFERGCPLKHEELNEERTWEAAFLSHRMDATACPDAPPAGVDVRDYLCTETIAVKDWYVMHGAMPVTMVSLSVPPNPRISADIMRRLTVNGTLPFRWTLICEITQMDQHKARMKLKRSRARAEMNLTNSRGEISSDPEARHRMRDIDKLLDDLAAGNESMLSMRMYAVVYGAEARTPDALKASLDTLEANTDALIRAIRKMSGADARREAAEALRTLYPNSLIGDFGPAETGREFEEQSASLAALIPQELDWSGPPAPHTLLSTATGRLIGVNIWDTISPLSVFIAGSGGGKSLALARIITDVLATVPKVNIRAIDYGGGMKPLAQLLGGRYLKLDPNVQQTINIWDYKGLADGIETDEIQLSVVVNFYKLLLDLDRRDRDSENILMRCIQTIYQRYVPQNKPGRPKMEPRLSNLIDILRTYNFEGAQKERALQLANALENYRGKFFVDAPTSDAFLGESCFDVYEIGDLASFSDRLKQAMAYTLTARVLNTVGKPDEDGVYTPYLLIGDELNQVRANYPSIIPLYERTARTGRKDNVRTMLAGQSYADIEDLPAFANNAGFRWIGKQNSTFDGLIRDANLSENTVAAINAVRMEPGLYSQFVVVLGNRSDQKVEIVQMELSPAELWAFSTHPSERNARTMVAQRRPDWSMTQIIGYLSGIYPRGLAAAGLNELPASVLPDKA